MHSRSTLLNQMAVGLGGRVAEKLVFGEPGSGAADDLSRVSRMARRMVRELGMSEALGDMTYEPYSDSGPVEESYSEEELRLIGAEVRRLVEEAGERAARCSRARGRRSIGSPRRCSSARRCRPRSSRSSSAGRRWSRGRARLREPRRGLS